MELAAEEGRVLGCLVEKQLTTPQQYPLTENALLAACNQTTSRDPVVSYDTATVRLAIRSLREKGLLRTVHRTGERSEKHRHLLDEALGLPTPRQALLALLLLRGPQTAAELRARTERMHPFGSTEEVEHELDAMPELVGRLERQPGQKEGRFVPLVLDAHPTQPVAPAAPVQPAAPRAPGLAEEVAALREEVAALRAEVAELRSALSPSEAVGPTPDPPSGS